jgi:hypothetical protein
MPLLSEMCITVKTSDNQIFNDNSVLNKFFLKILNPFLAVSIVLWKMNIPLQNPQLYTHRLAEPAFSRWLNVYRKIPLV